MKKISLLAVTLLLFTLAATGQQRRYYTGADTVFSVETGVSALAVEARGALLSAKECSGPGKEWWGIAWNCRPGGDMDYVVLRPENTDFGQLTDRRVVNVELGRMVDGKMETTGCHTMERHINGGCGDNSLLLEWEGGVLRVFAGDKDLYRVMEGEVELPTEAECMIISSGKVDLKSLVVEWTEDRVRLLSTAYTMEEIMARLAATSDPMEGMWRYLDRETDDSRARPGGLYRLVTLRNGDGYDILYHDGAKVNCSAWKPLMLKGRLAPTPFRSHFDLTWYDSMMEPMTQENNATLSEEGILTLEFPLYRSRMRFCRGALTD